MLANKLRRAAAAPLSIGSISYITFVDGSFSSGTVTFNSVSIGAASSDRVIALYIGGGFSGADQYVSSVTIGGISASEAVRTNGGSNFRHNSIWYATVPTGTTATIVVNASYSSTNNLLVFVSRIVDLNSTTPVATASDYTDAQSVGPERSVNLDAVYNNSVVFAGYGVGGSAATNTDWSGSMNLTEEDFQNVGNSSYTIAQKANRDSGSKSVVASVNDASVNRPGLVVATWH